MNLTTIIKNRIADLMTIRVLWIVTLIFGCCFVYAQSDDLSLEDFYTSGDTRAKDNNCYEITTAVNWSAGGVWYKLPIDIKSSFEMQVELMLGCKDDTGADGIVFIFSPHNGLTGRPGEGMGFAGLYPSLGIELDTWQNFHLADPAEDHIALMANGYVDHFSSLKGPITIPNVEDCKLHTLTIQWIEINKTLNITLDGNPVLSYQGDILSEIFGNSNKIYWGVTAATGKFNNRHEICFKKLDFELALETLTFSPIRASKILEEKIIPLDNLSFDSGSATISRNSQVELFKLVNLMRDYPTKSLDIFGHTDNVGNENTNQKISYARAKAVSNFLIKHGISPDRLIVQGLGEWYPKSSNYTEEGRQLNRRIEIKFYDPRT